MTNQWERPKKVNAGGDAPVCKVWRARKPVSNLGSREVIVKVTGRTKNAAALQAQLAYMTRKGELSGEHSTGQILHGKADLKALRERWETDNLIYAWHPSCTTQSVSVVLSMPEGTPTEAVRQATRDWAVQHISPMTEWFAVQHADRSHYHSHVSIRAVQIDGYRVRPTLPIIQEWRETFARSLTEQGVNALATPRREKIERLLAQKMEQTQDRCYELPTL